jgi:hypothetical protein
MQRWTLSLLPFALAACTPTDEPAEKDSADTAPVDEDLDGHSTPASPTPRRPPAT